MSDLVRFGSVSAEMGRFLERSVKVRRNIVISGGTGSGKTTLLNVLSEAIPSHERVVTVEDAAELQLAQPHVTHSVHGYRIKDLFVFDALAPEQTPDQNCTLVPTGVLPECLPVIRAQGLNLPASVHAAVQQSHTGEKPSAGETKTLAALARLGVFTKRRPIVAVGCAALGAALLSVFLVGLTQVATRSHRYRFSTAASRPVSAAQSAHAKPQRRINLRVVTERPGRAKSQHS